MATPKQPAKGASQCLASQPSAVTTESGTSYRWVTAVENWAEMMETIEFTSIHWAFFQYATAAGWSAE